MPTRAAGRDILSVTDYAPDVAWVLRRALALKRDRARGRRPRTLRNRTLALVFEKPSTRTRTSFEVGVRDLGGAPIYLSSHDLQLGRGETIADTARVLSRYVDGIVYRAFHHADEVELAKWASVPVINALDDLEHPCQIAADLLTMYERWKGTFSGHRLAYIGDGNNVLNSLLLGSAAVGLDIAAASPKGYGPNAEIVQRAQTLARTRGASITLTDSIEEAVRGADAVYTDVWVSMGEEAETAARTAAFQGYQINDALLARAHPDAFVLHDLPAHRGLEITDAVMDGPRAALWDQAENRLHAQKALLEWALLGAKGSRGRAKSR
ncbi:MAG: ornithine carbamoyltransferase [Thermoplasmata archaeon]